MKIEALMEKKADIMRQLKEAESQSGQNNTVRPPDTSEAATSVPQ